MTGSSPGKEAGYLDDLMKPEPDVPADVKTETVESSTTEGEKPAPSPSADAKAEDKPAEGAKAEPKSVLDALNSALKKDAVQEQSPGSKAEKDKPADAPADAAKAEADKWDGKSPLHEHPRFKEIIAQRDSFKEKAGAFDQFIGGVAESGLNVQEFNELLGVGSLIKRDPEKALERIDAVREQLLAIVGDKLEPALAKRVDDGEISEQDARALSRAQARSARHEQRTQETVEQTQANRQREHLLDCDRAGSAWMAQQAKLDPDWPKKQELVREAAEAIVRERGLPPTIDDALKVMKVAYQRVNERVRAFVPAKPRVEPPVKAGAASTQHAPQARSIREAMDNALKLTSAA